MIKQCNEHEKQVILDYIGNDYHRCLYLYLDIIKYGCSSDMTRTWIQLLHGEVSAVILAYHTAFHIFSKKNNYDPREIDDLVSYVKPTIINGAADTIKKLEPYVSNNSYHLSIGHIGEWMGKTYEIDCSVVEASCSDILEVARLLYENEDIGASYLFDDLLKQMQERLEQGFVHSYVVHRDQKVASHLGTGAEVDGVCTIAYGITAPQYRGQGIASILFKHVCSIMKKSGKRVFSVYYSDNARKFHQKVGFVDVCEFGKLYRNAE